MNNINFVDRVKKHFSYLESEFGFKVASESNSEIRPQTDGAVEYISNTTGIMIDSETGYVTIRFYRLKDGSKYYLTPVDIHEYFNTNSKEKELLLSTNPADKSAASSLFDKKFLLNQPGWKGSRGTVSDLDQELINFSNWLKKHAELCLLGNFTLWPKFYEYKIHRARADHLRRGKSELGYAQVEDANGNWKLIQQPVFKDQLEHIERLQKEFQDQ
jgi:hypothetical protein